MECGCLAFSHIRLEWTDDYKSAVFLIGNSLQNNLRPPNLSVSFSQMGGLHFFWNNCVQPAELQGGDAKCFAMTRSQRFNDKHTYSNVPLMVFLSFMRLYGSQSSVVQR